MKNTIFGYKIMIVLIAAIFMISSIDLSLKLMDLNIITPVSIILFILINVEMWILNKDHKQKVFHND